MLKLLAIDALDETLNQSSESDYIYTNLEMVENPCLVEAFSASPQSQ